MRVIPLFVVGPTGSGKSDLAVDIALATGGEVINCDSMQLYRGMDVGTAKLSMEQRRGVRHHLLDIWDITQTASVADYQQQACTLIESMLKRQITPIIVGGSMLYYQALVDGWEFPSTDPAVREELEQTLHTQGLAVLRARLEELDPVAAASILPSDPRRTVRALEVIISTGKPFAASKPQIGPARWGSKIIAPHWEKDQLLQRLELRTELMFGQGLVEEVAQLEELGLREAVTASRAIGYAEVLKLRAGQYTLEQAQERTFISTRQYVRRQLKWLTKDPRIDWIDSSELEQYAQKQFSER